MNLLRLPRREDDPAAGHDRDAIPPACGGRRSRAGAEHLAVDHHTPAEGIATADPHPVLKEHRVAPCRLGIGVGPEERPRGEIDGDGRAGAGRTDKHAIAERRGQSTDAAQMAFPVADRALLLEFGEGLRPEQRPISGGEDIETDLPPFFNEDEQLIADRERGPEIPTSRWRRTPRESWLLDRGWRGIGGGQTPRQFAAVGEPIGRQGVGPRRCRRERSEHAIEIVDRRAGERSRVALHGKHQRTIARQRSTRGIVEDAADRRPGLGITALVSLGARGRGIEERPCGSSRLQPHALAGLEVDSEEAHRSMG